MLTDRERGQLKRIMDHGHVIACRLIGDGVSKHTAGLVKAELLEAAITKAVSKNVADRLQASAERIRSGLKD